MNLNSNSRPLAMLKLSEGPQASHRAAPLVSRESPIPMFAGWSSKHRGPQFPGFLGRVTRYAAQFPCRPCRRNARNLFWFHRIRTFLVPVTPDCPVVLVSNGPPIPPRQPFFSKAN